MLEWALAVVVLGGLGALHLHGLHSVVLFVFGRMLPVERGEAGRPGRMVALVVAHDEEAVIATAVESLMAQDVDVVVVADNCTDGTADVARSGGARVLERRTEGPEGKGAALSFGVREILTDESVTAIAFFDADNEVDSGFARAVGRRLSHGESVVQGFVDSANAGATWVAGSSALGFWAIAEVAQRPREGLRLSAPLMGTAWAAERDICERYVGRLDSLTDDLELGARLAADGVRVAYEPDARALDEKPTGFGAAYAQRGRWMQGRWSVAFRHLPTLLKRAVFGPGIAERARALDVAGQLFAPSLLFTAVVVLAIAGALSVARSLGMTELEPYDDWILGSWLAGAGYFAVPLVAIARHLRSGRLWFYYLVQPLYIAASLPLGVVGFFRRGERTWSHTRHGDAPSRDASSSSS